MEKQLKDYLHLYLGCEMEVKHKQIAILSGVSYDERGKYFIHLNDKENGYYILFIQEAKPILRPLSDMSEEEKILVYLWEYPNYKSGELIKNDSDEDFFVVKNENGMKVYINQHHFSAETTRKLLKAGFDLFGLIESGIALDKTKLQTP